MKYDKPKLSNNYYKIEYLNNIYFNFIISNRNSGILKGKKNINERKIKYGIQYK